MEAYRLIKTTKMKTTNPHSWFFAYLKTTDGWGRGFDEVIKEAVIYDYSGGKTESLKELFEKYPAQYRRMRAELTPKLNEKQAAQDERLDKARKRLMAAIFENIRHTAPGAGADYVKRVACRGAGETRFNDIPLPTLKNLYNRFKNKNLKRQVDELVKEMINYQQ